MTPDLYTVELQPNMYEGPADQFTFNGSVNIRMKCESPSRNLTVHSNKLNVTDGTLRVRAESATETGFDLVSHEFDLDRQFLIVHLNQDTVPGHFYHLYLEFVGPLKDDLNGLYLSSYQRNNETV